MKLPLRISGTGYIINVDGNVIASVTEFGIPEAKEIVRACNAHDELLAGLKWALQYGTFDVAEDNPLHAHALDNAQAAIIKAETP